MASPRAPRGMHDTLPEDADLWRFIRDTAERVARLYDYRQIDTPIVEDASVFLHTAGDESDIVQKEVYLFEDRGGDRLALRPEGTAAACRAYIEHGMSSRPQPVRLFYFGPFFRYDRPQAGRYRQLHQFGVEAIGTDSPAADAELIDLQLTLYRELGFPPDELTLRINSIGTAETRRRYTEALTAHFAPHVGTLSRDSQRRFETNILRILDSKEDLAHPAVQSAPSILDYLTPEDAEHFAAVKSHLDALGIAYEVDPRIVRGLDYYARTVWEVEPPGAGGQSTIGAGGRYDGLIEILGGPPTPAVGFATGIERIALNMRERGLGPTKERAPDVVTIPLGERGATAAAQAAATLRAAGVAVRNGLPGRSMRAAMRAADAAGAHYALIVGDAEADAGTVVLKPLRGEDEQRTVPLGDLLIWSASLLDRS
ncbi:MAG: histidine--tRNA ligase [Chloroflexi bacterium]|nr:MAG: histidine--tRNA ligase [Chloroflexota bacterium]